MRGRICAGRLYILLYEKSSAVCSATATDVDYSAELWVFKI
jgi:hypothetical protein